MAGTREKVGRQLDLGFPQTRMQRLMESLAEEGLLHKKDFPEARLALENLEARGVGVKSLVGGIRSGRFTEASLRRHRSMSPSLRKDAEVASRLEKIEGLVKAAFFHHVIGMASGNRAGYARFKNAVLEFLGLVKIPLRAGEWAENSFAEFAFHLGVTPRQIARESDMLAASLGRRGTRLSNRNVLEALTRRVVAVARSERQKQFLLSRLNSSALAR